jgi:dihydrofolate synthase/folylpolyglutamate synthase
VGDGARSDHAGVQAQLDRLALLSPGGDILGLERISALLEALGNPQRALPPVLHVAGTNGKGSTCAFLRAAIEAAGLTAHVYTSPHLVRFNERIRLAGRLIGDEALAALLAETLDAAGGMEVSFFEAATAAAYLAFARTSADACIVEVGLGGRLDATNVIEAPLVCGIAALGHDHHAFLGDSLEGIAAEKAGIAKSGVPLLTQKYPPPLAARIAEVAAAAGAPWLPEGEAWEARAIDGRLVYRDAAGSLDLPLPRLAGEHQAMNAALAVAMLRHQQRLAIADAAFEQAMGKAEWPARLQPLGSGPLRDMLAAGAELWLDGGHNPAAAAAIAGFFEDRLQLGPRPFHVIAGLLANKDAKGVIEPFRALAASVQAVPVPGHDHHGAEALGAKPAAGIAEALAAIAPEGPPVVLITGSLYLAGTVLAQNDQLPD